MNKKLSKVLITSASAAALLAAYPSVAQNANEAGFDIPAVTAQAATSRTTFIREANALPSVDNLTTDDVADVRAVRSLYIGLSAEDKADADVQRWEGYLSEKEEALPVDAQSFLSAAQALPDVDEITEADRADISIVRDMYNELPATDRNRDDVQRWKGYVEQKLAALPSDAESQFIVEARSLPHIAEIEAMNAEEFAAAKVGIQQARSTYRQLNAEQRADSAVDRWAGYVSEKEAAFGITFQLEARALPSVSDIATMDEAELLAAQEDAAAVRALYNPLSETAKNDADVSRWEGFLTQKEDAINAALDTEEPEESLDEIKEAAIEELNDYVDLDAYNDDWSSQIESIISETSDDIDSATTPARVQTLLADAQAQIDEAPTIEEIEAETLEQTKENAKDRLEVRAENERSRYSGADLAEFDAIIARANTLIDGATTQERVGTIEVDAYAAIGELTPDATEEEILAEAKEDAVAELENYVDEDDYTNNAETLDAAIEAGTANINDATSQRTVGTALADAKAAIDEIATDSESLAEYKARSIEQLEGYVDAEDYTINAEALNTAIAEGTTAINAGESSNEAWKALEAAKDVIDDIESDTGIAVREAEEALAEYNPSAGAYQDAGGSKDDDVYEAAFVAEQDLRATLDVSWVEEDIVEATNVLTAALTDLDNATAALQGEILSDADEALASVETDLEEFTEAGGNESSDFYQNVLDAQEALENRVAADPQEFSEIVRTTNNLNNHLGNLNDRTEQMNATAAEEALDEATEAVETAEAEETQESVDAAQELINVLPENDERDELQNKLNEVAADVAVSTATEAVETAETLANNLDEDSTAGDILDAENAVSEARDLVNALPSSRTKVDLQGQVTLAEFEVGQHN